MARVRNLIVGCDGTWNEPEQLANGKSAPTNVVKFMRALRKGKKQRQHYEEGVGTRAWEALRGGIYGYGLDDRIVESYRFLCNRFADEDWDRDENKVFLIGFSRGAYTARRISGLIAHSGIPVDEDDVQVGWEIYRQKDKRSAAELKRSNRFFDIPVEFVGVWDTVKATNDEDYHDNKIADNVVAGYHAVAIDEKRKNFPALRWNKNKRVTQVWFAGVHSDVGGGYAQAGLADVALEWMIYRGLDHGLDFKADYVEKNVKPSPKGKIHDSYTGIWTALGEKPRSIPKTALLHPSVGERVKQVASYKPTLPAEPIYWEP